MFARNLKKESILLLLLLIYAGMSMAGQKSIYLGQPGSEFHDIMIDGSQKQTLLVKTGDIDPDKYHIRFECSVQVQYFSTKKDAINMVHYTVKNCAGHKGKSSGYGQFIFKDSPKTQEQAITLHWGANTCLKNAVTLKFTASKDMAARISCKRDY